MKLKMAFVMDPVGTINTEKDTTFVLMLEAQARGHEVWYLELKDMFVKEAQAFGNATQISLERSEDFYKLGDTQTLPLESFDAVWMRKDPPVNNDFLYATYILSLIDENKTKVLNNPTGIRESNEKLYSLFFPEIIPQSIVTKNIGQLEEFLSEAGGQIVVKPLDGYGGEGIFYVREGDRNANVILESITKFGTEYVIGQKFIEKVSEGDKRIIILNGEPLGAVLRVPKPGGEFRSNFHSGGSPAKSELTQRDLEICEAIGPRLRKDGLYLVGLDVIGGYVTEINTTSPTGVQEINNLDGVKLETQIIEFAEELCGS
ncbi:MAG: glutathione synthase [Candidatus Dadabacteria bacterium]|nr:glutathione synthase [Candidatus Dadabacteria bacterium]TDI91407.1 MAG: glutathione synthase [Candidatus Dadabacteria bacterium]